MNQNDFIENSATPFERTVCDLEEIDHDAITQEAQDFPTNPTFTTFGSIEGSPRVRD